MAGGRYGTARIGVLTIIDEEFGAVREALGGVERVLEIGATSYFSPSHSGPGDPNVVLVQSTDRSNVPAFSAGRDLIEDFRPEIVIVCGIAGGIAGRGADIGHVVVADVIHYLAFRKLTAGRDQQRHYAFDQPTSELIGRHSRPVALGFDLDERVTAIAPERAPEQAWPPQIHHGPIVVGEKVLGDPSHPEQQDAVSRFDNALAVDMESVGIARAVHELRTTVTYNPRLMVIRGISDIVHASPDAGEAAISDDQAEVAVVDNNAQRTAWKAYAAAAAAAYVGAMTERFLALPDARGDVRASGNNHPVEDPA